MDERTDGWTNELTDGQTDVRTSRLVDAWTDRHADRTRGQRYASTWSSRFDPGHLGTTDLVSDNWVPDLSGF